jgi:steroid delta-isomerase-like uncharacterized protein
MSAEANAAAAKRVLDEAFNQGSLEVLDEICSPDVVSHDPAEPEDVRGIDAHKERVAGYRAAMSDLTITADDVVASGDKVAIRWSVRGTNDGELQGIPATGRKVEFMGISIDHFDSDGKIVETWDSWDNAGFMAQLGLAPELATQAG